MDRLLHRGGPVTSSCRNVLFVGVAVMSGCDGGGAAPRSPTLLSPYQGQATGSPLSTQTPPNPLRPEFRWTPVDGAVGYEIQIDGGCSGATDCASMAPYIDQKTSGTSFIPSVDLTISTSAPVGARYFWRVSACDASGACATWSRFGIVDVGRQRQDFNGDGYADLAVVARSSAGSALFVYFGGQTLPTSPSWTLRPDTSANGDVETAFSRVLWLGDVNADGFADLAVVVNHQNGPDSVRLYLGGAQPGTTLAKEASTSISSDAAVVSLLAGDMNGDGFADLFQSYLGPSAVSDVVSFGPEFGPENGNSRPLSSAMIAACDFDSDGYADLVESDLELFRGGPKGPIEGSSPTPISGQAGKTPVACPWNINGLGSASLILSTGVGQPSPLVVVSSPVTPSAAACDGPLPALSPGSGGGGGGSMSGIPVVDVGDTDGDGYDDLLVGDPVNNRAALFFGGCPMTRVLELPGDTQFSGTPGSRRRRGSNG